MDTLNGSDFSNIKELRVQHAGNPIRAFLRLILHAVPSFCAQVTKRGQTRNASIEIGLSWLIQNIVNILQNWRNNNGDLQRIAG